MRIVTNPAAALLLLVFCRGQFRGGDISEPGCRSYIFERFELGLSSSSLTSTFWPLASLPARCWGEWRPTGPSRRWRGGRIRVQGVGLILAAPFVFLTGWSTSVPILIAALIGAGMCKGIYDSNIFASLFRCGSARGSRDGGRADEHRRLDGRLRGADRGRHRVGAIRPGRDDRLDGGRVFAGGLARARGGPAGRTSGIDRRELKLLIRHQETAQREFHGGEQTRTKAPAMAGPGAATSTPSSG